MIVVAFISFLIAHFIGKPFDFQLFSGIATLLGIPTAFISISKSLQGFESTNRL